MILIVSLVSSHYERQVSYCGIVIECKGSASEINLPCYFWVYRGEDDES